MDKLLTISVAAYNVEKFLSKLMESVLGATNRELIEVLVVNDGSKDKTAEITEGYVKQYPGIVRLIDKENGGHGSTINKGIEEATGKYFRALDGDDWLNTMSLELLVKRLEHDDADLILTDYINCYEGGDDKIDSFHELMDGADYSFDELVSKVKWMRYHTVIYKTQILKAHKIRLDEHCFYVDSEFMLLPIPYVDKITYYQVPLYCYRLGVEGQSVSPESRIRHKSDSYKVAQRLMKFYEELPAGLSEQKKKYITDGIAAHMLWHFKTLLMCKTSKEVHSELKAFDLDIKARTPEVYEAMTTFKDSSTLIKMARGMNYLMYYPTSILKRVKER